MLGVGRERLPYMETFIPRYEAEANAMTTFFIIAGLLLVAAFLGLRRSSRVSPHGSMHEIDLAVVPDYIETDRHVAEALSRHDARRAERLQREDQAYAYLSEAHRRFNEVLVEQRGKTIDMGRGQKWPMALLRKRLGQVNELYDTALREELKCAERLYGLGAVAHAQHRLGISIV